MKRILVICLILASASLTAGDLAVARAALRDGLGEVARRQVADLTSDEAHLVILESLAQEGDWKGVATALTNWPSANGPAFDYYRAAVSGDRLRAAEILRTQGDAVGLAEARLLEADLLFNQGAGAEATNLWNQVISATNATQHARTMAGIRLGREDVLREAYQTADSAAFRRLVGVQLGQALLRNPATQAEGSRLIRTLIQDAPDTPGAREALLAIAALEQTTNGWSAAVQTYRHALETWPDAARLPLVQEGLGRALARLGRVEEACPALIEAERLYEAPEDCARCALARGDLLAAAGRPDEGLAAYRLILTNYPSASFCGTLKVIVRAREQEDRGREFFRDYRYDEAQMMFEEVARIDPTRQADMDYFVLLCLYGRGFDDSAMARARDLVATCTNVSVKAQATRWLAKFLYNRGSWRESAELFAAYAETGRDGADEALLWQARAAFANHETTACIATVSSLAARYPQSACLPAALIVQGEALMELSRHDEARLIFEQVALQPRVTSEERLRAQVLKADTLFSTGADNAVRYRLALEMYRALLAAGQLEANEQIVVAYKSGRCLEKLHRLDEAVEAYYAQVLLAFRAGCDRGFRYSDEARAAFSKATFKLAEEYLSRGRDLQAVNVLEHLAGSDLPAAAEAQRKIKSITKRGQFE